MLAYDWNFLGLSTETKPLSGEKVVDGSTFYECDTSTFFIYYKGEWYQQTFVTEDGINFWLYKTLMKKMFGKLFDSNISKGKIIKPTTGTEIEFTNSLPAQITDLTGYGDTFQQTYSGKNLINNSVTTYDYSNIDDQYITITSLPTGLAYENTYASGYPVVIFKVFDGTPYIGKTIRLKANFDVEDSVYRIIRMDSNAGNRSVLATASQNGQEISYTIPDELGTTNYFGIGFGADAGTTVNYTNLIMTIDNADMTYEPYVGGTASPNPDYPQTVQTVTGEQTVTINGEQVYPIDLGTIELCKIGDYQDYIYKSGDDWYVHRTIEKVSLDGSTGGYNSGENWYYASFTNLSKPTPVTSGRIISNYFTESNSGYMHSNKTVNGLCAINSNTHIVIRNTNYSDAGNYQTWLGTTTPIFYYALATPTDTKITDTTLISNLNSLLNYMFPAGDHQIVITADGLPMALKLTITEKE